MPESWGDFIGPILTGVGGILALVLGVVFGHLRRLREGPKDPAAPPLAFSSSNSGSHQAAGDLEHSLTPGQMLKVLAYVQEQQQAADAAKPATRGDIRDLRKTMSDEAESTRRALAEHATQDEERFADIMERLDGLGGEAAE